MRFRISVPTGSTRGPIGMVSVLASAHEAIAMRHSLSLWIQSRAGQVSYSVDLPDECRRTFLRELQDVYPGCTIEPDAIMPSSPDRERWGMSLRLSPDVLPLRTFETFIDDADQRTLADPISGMLSSLHTGSSGRVACDLRLTIKPARRSRLVAMDRITRRWQHRFAIASLREVYLRWSTDHRFICRRLAALIWWLAKRERDCRDSPDKPGMKLFECRISAFSTVPSDSKPLAIRKLNEIASALGRFTDGTVRFHRFRIAKRDRSHRTFLMSPREIATIWHPITVSGDTVSRVTRSAFREIEPPIHLAANDRSATVLGRVKFRQQRNQFGIAVDDLRRHMLAIGKTGCGKSTFLLNVVRQQMEAKRGVVLVDPHGDLANAVLNHVPGRRTNDVIWFDAAEANVGFNPLVGSRGSDSNLVADAVLTSFKNVFGFDEGSAPRLLHIFRNCLLSLIGTQHASLSSIQRLLTDANFRRSAISNVTNEAVREFWLTEFNRWNDRDRVQYVASLQNKLGAFTTNERLQRIFAPQRKGIELREIMDRSQILICSLSKGQVGHDASTLLGSLLLSSLQIAAMSRADIDEDDRTDCVVVVDEFHSYLADGNSTMADALAESRKYRTSYVLSTQMLEQLDSDTLAGVLGNCGSTLCMTVGPRDAEVLAELLGSGLSKEDLMKIPKYHGYLRLLIDGKPSTFSMTTLAPAKLNSPRANVVRQVSQQRYGQR